MAPDHGRVTGALGAGKASIDDLEQVGHRSSQSAPRAYPRTSRPTATTLTSPARSATPRRAAPRRCWRNLAHSDTAWSCAVAALALSSVPRLDAALAESRSSTAGAARRGRAARVARSPMVRALVAQPARASDG